MILIDSVQTPEELLQILELQERNHIDNIDDSEMYAQGFVTLRHTLPELQQMNALAPSIIAKENGKMIGYALVMIVEARSFFTPLESMFRNLEKLEYRNKPLNEYHYYVMGQICIDKDYRRTGVFNLLYQKHKEIYQNRFDFVITEVSTRNQRSYKAHERVGFKTIDVYQDELDEWAVIVWDWS
jgi:L-amino acid N-acyltransferase YncA